MALTRNEHVQTSMIDGATVLYHPESDGYLVLDAAASRTWATLANADTVETVIDALAATGAPRASVDVEAELADLSRLGMIRGVPPRAPTHPATPSRMAMLTGPAMVAAFAALALTVGSGQAWGASSYGPQPS